MTLHRILNRSITGTYPCVLVVILSLLFNHSAAQTCPAFGTTSVAANPNTYYPATTAALAAGSTSIALGAVTYGATPISAWDIVLIIQMQGAQINSGNSTNYGAGAGTSNGYLINGNLLAGNMEFAVATNAVPLAGGTLNINSGLTNSYKNANFGAMGQFRYQVIRVPLYYNMTLTGTITAPAWNGTSGGVVAFSATNTLNMNGQLINATGKGFRGGGGLNHANPGIGGANTDYRSSSTNLNCGTKGEGIAGTPRYLFASGNVTLLDLGAALEGYPNGCLDRGAPGNAGGGATDGDPISNSNNAGGGGGGNGGIGGGGGRSWSSQLFTGGKGGAAFAQASSSRLVMGGGGGSGSSDGGTGTPANGLASSGAPGGGIVIIRAGAITNTGTITVNGASPNTTLANDGSGGGGAGGSVLIIAGSGLSGVTVNANGSDGASNTGAGAAHGPGGGGAGGVIYSNGALGSSSATGGAPGTTQGFAPPTFGATAGAAGTVQITTVAATPPFPLICNTLLKTNFSVVSASSTSEAVTIYWQMDNEADAVAYTIEKSFDGAVFSLAGSISAPKDMAGTNGITYKDATADKNHPVVYYRVRCTLADGVQVLSKIVGITKNPGGRQLTITPNPVTTGASMYLFAAHNALLSIRLTDLTGNTVLAKQYALQPGANTIYIDGLQVLPAGIYLLQTDDGTNRENTKLVIQH